MGGVVDIVTYRLVLDADVRNDELFRQAVQWALDSGLFGDERDLGQIFGVSRAQVNRWKNGRGLPGQGSRKTVISRLRARAKKPLRLS